MTGKVSPIDWVVFGVVVFLSLAIDRLVFGRSKGHISFREAAVRSTFFVTVGLLFSVYVYVREDFDSAVTYLLAYVVEESLSVDNLFVFLVLFTYFKVNEHQQQRVLVAQALAAQPDVLLLDEPVTGLDLPSQLRILDVIADHAAHGGCVVFSTHHMAEARRADRVLLMAGCVLADGAPEAVLVPTLLAEAFGGRLLRDGSMSILVDDHGHDHGDGHPAELVPHHGLHQHQHEHGSTERAPDAG